MERTNYILIILLITFSGLFQLEASNREDILKAYQQGDMTQWKAVIDRMEKNRTTENETKLELLNYYYGYIGYTLGEKRHKEARTLINSAYVQLEALEKQNYKAAELKAYRAAFYGYEIALNKLKAPYLGPKSIAAAKEALDLDNNNPLALTQYGNIQTYMPSLMGGSKKEGLEYYQKAMHAYEQYPVRAQNDWNYLNLLITITMAHIRQQQDTEARACYQKLMKIAPEMSWAIEALNPSNIKNEL
ncbi:MAG: hypothetical protein PHF38_02190 [Bacteroidales bacterium]|nr:hypothetical protein [Bacteroidales bacterium]MDD4431310.1 hypothetical protein [Bacteroidales bacterium]